jgi:hypothetical protein
VVANPTWATQITTDWGAFVIDFDVDAFQPRLLPPVPHLAPVNSKHL